MLLGSYNLPRPNGIYWTPSPIFVHEAACARAKIENDVAPIVRANPLVSVRAYDTDDQCLYDLGQVCAGQDDCRTAFINLHSARPGCLLTLLERLPK